jgi:hypothetical protein
MSRFDSLTQIRVRLTHVTTQVSPTSLERIRQAWAGVPMEPCLAQPNWTWMQSSSAPKTTSTSQRPSANSRSSSAILLASACPLTAGVSPPSMLISRHSALTKLCRKAATFYQPSMLMEETHQQSEPPLLNANVKNEGEHLGRTNIFTWMCLLHESEECNMQVVAVAHIGCVSSADASGYLREPSKSMSTSPSQSGSWPKSKGMHMHRTRSSPSRERKNKS